MTVSVGAMSVKASKLIHPVTHRSATPLMTNLLPAAVGADGRVNLFVGNVSNACLGSLLNALLTGQLPYRVRWQDLKDLFRKAGTVLRADVSLGQDNRSRGYGTVLMGSREDAARAIGKWSRRPSPRIACIVADDADRFNGFTWQTRTLEVRPDRLPPEYEPQVQPVHHPPPVHRVPMFPYVGGSHYAPGPGPGPHGPGWHPHLQHRPPMHNFGPPPPHHHMAGAMSHPGMSLSPHPPHMSIGGSAPGPGRPRSPAHFGPNGLHPHPPLSGQNTGSHGFGQLGASPLAGSLTTGADLPRPGSSLSNPLGISPHSSSLALPRAPSPAHASGPGSRPTSGQGHRSVSPIDPTRPPHSNLQPSNHTVSAAHGPGPNHGPPPPAEHGHMPHLEGLGHKSAILGPPSTLHDRVVFVSNVSTSVPCGSSAAPC